MTDTELGYDTYSNSKFSDQSPVYVRMSYECMHAQYVKITRSCLNLTLRAEHTQKSSLKQNVTRADFDTAVNRDLWDTIRYHITLSLNMRQVTSPLQPNLPLYSIFIGAQNLKYSHYEVRILSQIIQFLLYIIAEFTRPSLHMISCSQ